MTNASTTGIVAALKRDDKIQAMALLEEQLETITQADIDELIAWVPIHRISKWGVLLQNAAQYNWLLGVDAMMTRIRELSDNEHILDGEYMHVAAKEGHIEMIELLFRHNPRLLQHRTVLLYVPIDYAVIYKQPKAIRFLRSLGCTSLQQNRNSVVVKMVTAASTGCIETVKAIYEIIPWSVDYSGDLSSQKHLHAGGVWTPMHEATHRRQDMTMVVFLHTLGSESHFAPSVRNNLTPIDLFHSDADKKRTRALYFSRSLLEVLFFVEANQWD